MISNASAGLIRFLELLRFPWSGLHQYSTLCLVSLLWATVAFNLTPLPPGSLIPAALPNLSLCWRGMGGEMFHFISETSRGPFISRDMKYSVLISIRRWHIRMGAPHTRVVADDSDEHGFWRSSWNEDDRREKKMFNWSPLARLHLTISIFSPPGRLWL